MIGQYCESIAPESLAPRASQTCIIRLCISEPGTEEPYYQQPDSLDLDNLDSDLPAQKELETPCAIPSHPFFKYTEGQPDIYQCRDAIDHASALIELCNHLDLDSETHGGLSPRAAIGYYWVSTLALDTLDYTRDRIVELDSEQQLQSELKTECLSTIVESLQTLGDEDRERVFDDVAVQMELSRSELTELVNMDNR